MPEKPTPTTKDFLDGVQDVVQVQSLLPDQQLKGWLDLALQKPEFTLRSMEQAQENPNSTPGQRFALRNLTRLSRSESDPELTAARLKGGLTALSRLEQRVPRPMKLGERLCN